MPSLDFSLAMTLILSLTGALIVGGYVLAYAAHCLFTVVERTGGGADAVSWPDEPIAAWIARGVFLGAIVMVWLGPSVLLARALDDAWLGDDPGLRFLLLTVPGLWLFLPIGVLSS